MAHIHRGDCSHMPDLYPSSSSYRFKLLPLDVQYKKKKKKEKVRDINSYSYKVLVRDYEFPLFHRKPETGREWRGQHDENQLLNCRSWILRNGRMQGVRVDPTQYARWDGAAVRYHEMRNYKIVWLCVCVRVRAMRNATTIEIYVASSAGSTPPTGIPRYDFRTFRRHKAHRSGHPPFPRGRD